jgi:membrane protein YdbS with pleckstrin-like domain
MTERRQLGIEAWLSRNHAKSTAVLVSAITMLWWVTHWSMHYAASSALTGADVAMVIAAVQIPASLYAKWAFETYKDIVK